MFGQVDVERKFKNTRRESDGEYYSSTLIILVFNMENWKNNTFFISHMIQKIKQNIKFYN